MVRALCKTPDSLNFRPLPTTEQVPAHQEEQPGPQQRPSRLSSPQFRPALPYADVQQGAANGGQLQQPAHGTGEAVLSETEFGPDAHADDG